MSKRITTLKQAIDLSLKAKPPGELDAKFKIKVQDEMWTCYTVHVGHRDLLLYCNEGTASLLVDSYGDRNAAELVDWNREDAE